LTSEEEHDLPGLGKGRIEALTDGIFGTVMTVLVLSLTVPVITSHSITIENTELISSFSGLLPDVLSYILSFAILGAFWIRHHMMFYFVVKVDRILLWLNILFLLTIGFIPFSTALIGRYPNLQLSLIIYGTNLIATSVTSIFLWSYAQKRKLLSSDRLDEEIMTRVNRRMAAGPLSYAVGILVSFIYPVLTLVIYIITLVFFMFNTGSSFRIRRRKQKP
jgi:uncharacterized membrane protein